MQRVARQCRPDELHIGTGLLTNLDRGMDPDEHGGGWRPSVEWIVFVLMSSIRRRQRVIDLFVLSNLGWT